MKSIQTRFIVLMVLIVSSMLGIFGVVSYVDSKAQKSAQLQSHLAAMEQRMSQSLPQVIWRLDREHVRRIVDSELGAPAILSVAVLDGAGNMIYGASSKALTTAQGKDSRTTLFVTDRDPLVQEFPLSMVVNGRVEPLGQVRIRATTQVMDAALYRETLRLVALILLMNLVIIGALYLVMRAVIMRPLYSVRDALGHIASLDADLSRRLPPSRWKEVDEVTHNFNLFANRLEVTMGASLNEVQQAITRIAQGGVERVCGPLWHGARQFGDGALGHDAAQPAAHDCRTEGRQASS